MRPNTTWSPPHATVTVRHVLYMSTSGAHLIIHMLSLCLGPWREGVGGRGEGEVWASCERSCFGNCHQAHDWTLRLGTQQVRYQHADEYFIYYANRKNISPSTARHRVMLKGCQQPQTNSRDSGSMTIENRCRLLTNGFSSNGYSATAYRLLPKQEQAGMALAPAMHERKHTTAHVYRTHICMGAKSTCVYECTRHIRYICIVYM